MTPYFGTWRGTCIDEEEPLIVGEAQLVVEVGVVTYICARAKHDDMYVFGHRSFVHVDNPDRRKVFLSHGRLYDFTSDPEHEVELTVSVKRDGGDAVPVARFIGRVNETAFGTFVTTFNETRCCVIPLRESSRN
jgi:hypothetical protein